MSFPASLRAPYTWWAWGLRRQVFEPRLIYSLAADQGHDCQPADIELLCGASAAAPGAITGCRECGRTHVCGLAGDPCVCADGSEGGSLVCKYSARVIEDQRRVPTFDEVRDACELRTADEGSSRRERWRWVDDARLVHGRTRYSDHQRGSAAALSALEFARDRARAAAMLHDSGLYGRTGKAPMATAPAPAPPEEEEEAHGIARPLARDVGLWDTLSTIPPEEGGHALFFAVAAAAAELEPLFRAPAAPAPAAPRVAPLSSGPAQPAQPPDESWQADVAALMRAFYARHGGGGTSACLVHTDRAIRCVWFSGAAGGRRAPLVPPRPVELVAAYLLKLAPHGLAARDAAGYLVPVLPPDPFLAALLASGRLAASFGLAQDEATGRLVERHVAQRAEHNALAALLLPPVAPEDAAVARGIDFAADEAHHAIRCTAIQVAQTAARYVHNLQSPSVAPATLLAWFYDDARYQCWPPLGARGAAAAAHGLG